MKTLLLLIAMFLAIPSPAQEVQISWNPSTTESVNYNVYRTRTGCDGFELLASALTGLEFFDTTVQPGVHYCYVATAVDVTGESGYSNTAEVDVPGLPPAVAPAQNLTASVSNVRTITLGWTASSTAGVQYEVYKRVNGGNWVRQAVLKVGTVGYTFTPAKFHTIDFYVLARKTINRVVTYSDPSNTVTVTQ